MTKKCNVSYPAILLNNDPLEYVQQYKYLGVIVSHNLCWSQHIQEVCNKARKVLGIIYRSISSHTNDPSTIFRLYIALVRPHLEYAAQMWNPHLEKDIHCLEKVQKFAIRICIKDYHETCENLLDFLKVPSLQNRRLFLSLCTFYCIKNMLPCGTVSHQLCHFHVVGGTIIQFTESLLLIAISKHNQPMPLEAVNSEMLLIFKHFVSPLLQ